MLPTPNTPLREQGKFAIATKQGRPTFYLRIHYITQHDAFNPVEVRINEPVSPENIILHSHYIFKHPDDLFLDLFTKNNMQSDPKRIASLITGYKQFAEQNKLVLPASFNFDHTQLPPLCCYENTKVYDSMLQPIENPLDEKYAKCKWYFDVKDVDPQGRIQRIYDHTSIWKLLHVSMQGSTVQHFKNPHTGESLFPIQYHVAIIDQDLNSSACFQPDIYTGFKDKDMPCTILTDAAAEKEKEKQSRLLSSSLHLSCDLDAQSQVSTGQATYVHTDGKEYTVLFGAKGGRYIQVGSKKVYLK